MKKVTIVFAAFAFVIAAAAIACNSSGTPSENREGITEMSSTISQDSLVSRGRYLVSIMGCNDCHSPKVMGPRGPELDTAHLLSGHPANMPLAKADPEAMKSWVLFNFTQTAYVGPWGTTYAANITSDASGIGNWSEAQFIKAMREGKLKGMDNTRPILPPMPWQGVGKSSDEDLKAIFTYLKSTKPVDNVVPAAQPPGGMKTN